MSGLEILDIAASATVQDQGRVGFLRYGVTGGGAMDLYALVEGQALLGNGKDAAAIEFAGIGGQFRATAPTWIALSGAAMKATLNGAALGWRHSLRLEAGDLLHIGAAAGGTYGYLHIEGGFQTEVVLGARATHLRAGFGHVLKAGQRLVGLPGAGGAYLLPQPEYFGQRVIRALWGPQSRYFSADTRAEFAATKFTVTPLRDRMGMRVELDMGAVKSEAGLTIASDAINLGDIQITGDGSPAILLADRGSSGGYPRIATIITADLGALAQIPIGGRFSLELIERAAAVTALGRYRAQLEALRSQRAPRLRDPHEMHDLLSYNLIGGVLRGDEHDEH